MEKPSHHSVSVAAGKLLAGAERLSSPTWLLPGSSAEWNVQLGGAHSPQPEWAAQLAIFKGRRGTGGARGATQTYQSPRRAQEAAAEESRRDASHRDRCLHGPTVPLRWGPQGQ